MPTLKNSIQTSLFALVGLTVSAIANAEVDGLLYATTPLDYELPKQITATCYEKENCPSIEVVYVDTNQVWLNVQMNRRIEEIAIGSTSMVEDVPKPAGIIEALNRFSLRQLDDLPKDSGLYYALSVMPRYQGHIDDFELFAIDGYTYMGGAHGLPFTENMVFDLNTRQQITLDDMLLPKQKPKFEALAHQAYRQWIRHAMPDANAEDYERGWTFSLSDNVTFGADGIEILYQPYEISPYAMGMPTLVVDYDQLDGIIKPEILAKLQ